MLRRRLVEVDTSDLDALLYDLRERGSSPIEAIKTIRDVKSCSLGDAKAFFATHPAWSDVHDAAQPLHDAAERALEGLPER
jgi:ribosomal protein L7/L12